MTSVVDSVVKFANDNPIPTAVFVGGAVVSILTHSCLKASKNLSAWKKNQMKDLPEQDRTEAAVSVVMQGSALGFLRGLLTCTVWPVEAAAVVYVMVSRDSMTGEPKKD